MSQKGHEMKKGILLYRTDENGTHYPDPEFLRPHVTISRLEGQVAGLKEENEKLKTDLIKVPKHSMNYQYMKELEEENEYLKKEKTGLEDELDKLFGEVSTEAYMGLKKEKEGLWEFIKDKFKDDSGIDDEVMGFIYG